MGKCLSLFIALARVFRDLPEEMKLVEKLVRRNVGARTIAAECHDGYKILISRLKGY
jgi:hypothetical protein